MSEPAGFAVFALAALSFTAAMFAGRQASLWLTTGVAAAVSLGLVLALGRNGPWAALRPSVRSVAGGVAVGVVMIGATHAAYRTATLVLPGLGAPTETIYGALEASPGPVVGLPVLLGVILVEELVWRGVLFELVRRRYGPVATVVITAMLYAVPQLAGASLLLFPVALACGFVWSAQRAWSGGLVAPLVAHVIWDLGLILLVPLSG